MDNRWKRTLDIRDLWAASEGKGGDMPVDRLGKAIAQHLKTIFKAQLNSAPGNDLFDPEFEELIDQLENITGFDDVMSVGEFDEIWAGVYDWADRNRVWIKTTV